MKIVVYAICKNEVQFVDRWMDSMSEADQAVVLDTGSNDGTAARLRARGALVTEETVTPWRFDTARNRSLELVPPDTDICVCTDLDEVFHPGWRAALERAWTANASQASYRYTWSFNPDGTEGVVFWSEKIHTRQNWRWTHPVHEVLQWTGKQPPGPKISVPDIQLDHHPDHTKSRGQYLPLLEQSVKEDPADDRNVHYLGREYLYKGRWDDCIRTLRQHLVMPTALWRDERAASMRFIAKAYAQKGDIPSAKVWYHRAIAEAPYLREPYMDFAMLLYGQTGRDPSAWEGVLYLTSCALAIADRPRTYICEANSWGSLPYDLRSLALYHTGRPDEALRMARLALEAAPSDPRLRRNVEFLEKKQENQD
ncbi:MAG: glycosyl transferase family 2 [Oscillospiraceae bacterium]|nr:glycosyl transferase family 2 [Oscillospiraceae bacterium]